MKFSHTWLQTYFEKPLPKPEKLAELLTAHIFEVEGIEEIKNASGNIVDRALDVKILPDRACYAYGHANLAREINAFTDAGFKNKVWNEIDAANASEELNAIMPNLSIADTGKSPIMTMRLVHGIANGPSPKWLSDALMSAGQRSISLVVDLTNYVMLDCGQPMHAFDADKIKGNLSIRYANDGETLTLLDGRVVTLDQSILVIADEEGALDIAGIKGGKKAEVDGNTKNIILTAGNFDASYIRKTSQKVGIKNDSTKRYENTINWQRVFDAQSECISLLKAESPNIIQSKLFCHDPGIDEVKKRLPVIRVDAAFISQKIGMDISTDEIVRMLKSLEIDVDVKSDGDAQTIEIVAPEYRGDLKVAEDIIEEVTRLQGMNSMPETVPKADIAVPALPSFFYSNVARNALLGAGFSEIYTHTLVEAGDYALANPLTNERSHLRNNLASGMKKALCFNVQNIDVLGSANAVSDDVRIFDIGHVFKGKKETWSLALGVASKAGKLAKEKNKRALQDAMMATMGSLGLLPHGNESLVTDENQTIIEGETEAVGGAVPVAYCIAEIDFEAVLASLPAPEEFKSKPEHAAFCSGENLPVPVDMTTATRFKRFSPYPYMVRDIAVFIPGPTGRAHELRDLIEVVNDSIVERGIAEDGMPQAVKKGLIARIRQFDEFEKKNKETGEVEKTSYGFRMVFQAGDRTLTDAEVQRVMDRILTKIGDKEGWEVR